MNCTERDLLFFSKARRLRGDLEALGHTESKAEFQVWDKAQVDATTKRGESYNPEEEEEYMERMMSDNMRAYTCHTEVDKYTQCIMDHKVLPPGVPIDEATIDPVIAEVKCPQAVETYARCMDDGERRNVIVVSAVEQPKCIYNRIDFERCLEKHSATLEKQDQYC